MEVERETYAHEGIDQRAGYASMQGWRVDMEDSHSIQLGIPEAPDSSWFAVFDGHGGAFTAQYAAQHVLDKILRTRAWKADHASAHNIGKAMVEGFLEIDEDLKKVRE